MTFRPLLPAALLLLLAASGCPAPSSPAEDPCRVCDANATCRVVGGQAFCSCKAGFAGDGTTCQDIDECTGASACGAHATCTNTPGSYTCACASGYEGDGRTCTDIDDCLQNNGGCHANALCTNTEGSRTCACAPPATGDGLTCTEGSRWGEATRLGHPEPDSAHLDNGVPAVAMDAQGNGLIVFTDGEQVWARRYVAASRTWGELVRVSTEATAGGYPQVAMAADGSALAVWWSTHVLFASHMEADGTWGAVQTLADAGEGNLGVGPLRMTPQGDALMVWSQSQAGEDRPSTLHARLFEGVQEAWLAAEELAVPAGSEADRRGGNPTAALVREGPHLKTVVLWQGPDDGDGLAGSIFCSWRVLDTRTSAGDWSAPARVESESVPAVWPQVVIDGTGRVTAVWERGEEGTGEVWVASTAFGEPWPPATRLSNEDAFGFAPYLAAGPGGAALMWEEHRMSSPSLYLSRLDTTWSPPHRLRPDSSGYPMRGEVAVSAEGHLFAVFTKQWNGRASVWGMESTPEGGWTEPFLLETDDAELHWQPRLALGPAGHALAAWQRETMVGAWRHVFGAVRR